MSSTVLQKNDRTDSVRNQARPAMSLIIHATEDNQEFSPLVTKRAPVWPGQYEYFCVRINDHVSVLLSVDRTVELRNALTDALTPGMPSMEAASV